MRISEVCKSFGENTILHEVSEEWNRVGMIFLTGRSGCGKSTLLNILGKIDECDSGIVLFGDGEEEAPEMLRRDYLSYVFQEYNLLSQKTVRENLEVALQIAQIPWNEAQVQKVLLDLQLAGTEERQVAVLSGGEKQRVAIARAVLKQSRVILADEPTGNLDEENARNCMSILKKISETSLVVVVTHDVEMAEEYGDRIYRIEEKKTVLVKDYGYENNELLPEFPVDAVPTEKRNVGRWIWRYTLGRAKEQKQKVGIVFVMTLVLLSLFLGLGIYSATKRLVNEVNTSLLENDYYTIEVLPAAEETQKVSEVIRQVEERISREENVREMLTYAKIKFFYSKGDGKGAAIQPVVVRNNEFFRERYNDLIGRFPSNKHEVIVNENLAHVLLPISTAEEALNQEVIMTANGREYSFTVVGVRTKEELDEQRYSMYILEDMYGEIHEHSYEASVVLVNNSGWTSEVMLPSGDEQLLAGRLPSELKEICVDIGTFPWIYQTVKSVEGKYFTAEELAMIPQQEQIDFLMGMRVELEHTSQSSADELFTIVGVVEKCDVSSIFVSEAYAEQCTQYMDCIALYVKNISDEELESIKMTVNDAGANLSANGLPITKTLGARFMIFLSIMAVVTVILILITIVMTAYFARSSVNERYYEVGVLKAIGASGGEVYRILLYDNLLVAGISVLLSIIILFVLRLIGLGKILQSAGMSMYEFEWWHIAVVAITGLLVCFGSSCRSMYKASRVQIIESIRKKAF